MRDARGPYLPVDDPWKEPESAHTPWTSIYLPLLPKVHVDAERAEVVARAWVGHFGASDLSSGTTLENADQRPDSYDQATLRTYLVTSNYFKEHLAGRGVPADLAAANRLTPMPRYIWVIESVDRQRRASGSPDVLGEIMLDATLTQFEPMDDPAAMMAIRIDSFAFITGIDGGTSQLVPSPAWEHIPEWLSSSPLTGESVVR